ncbi:zinc-binding dehydrogenase [Paenalcaligenes hominis]|uniref:zinc-dependent alcohol dehydrogenase n=1 Tax=Paenalcaligenes hominis TaxID=643674 RepID=UPI00352400A2
MMQAAIFEGFGKPLRIEKIPAPTPASDEVILAVKRCGICGSDLHMTEDPTFNLQPGSVLGHEFAGEIIALGKDVTHLKIGQQVAVMPYHSCGHCAQCLARNPAWCSEMALMGGGYGEFAAVAARLCIPLPAETDFETGALVEPLAIALHGVRKSGLQPGQDIIVYGAGPIGLAVVFWARRFGARKIIVEDIKPERANQALELGANHFVCAPQLPTETTAAKLGNQGADIVFDCAGVPGLIAQAIPLLRPQGTLLILGLCTKPDSFIPFEALSKELRIQTAVFFNQQEYESTLDMLTAMPVLIDIFINKRTSLHTLPALFETLKSNSPYCKVMICHEH